MVTITKRPNLLIVVIILTVFGGVSGIISSFPIITLYNSIKQGGITVSDKVSILHVEPDTPASAAGLENGDVIYSINGKEITTASEFTEISKANQDKFISIDIVRNDNILSFQLVPRISPPPGQGKLGISLVDFGVEKKSFLEILPQVIIRSYSGVEEKPIWFFSSQNQIYQDKSLSRLQSLFFGMASLIIGIGLWKWKKWAYYGYLIITFLRVLKSIPYLINPVHYRTTESFQSLFYPLEQIPNFTDTIIYIVLLFVDLLMAYYLYRQKKFFNN